MQRFFKDFATRPEDRFPARSDAHFAALPAGIETRAKALWRVRGEWSESMTRTLILLAGLTMMAGAAHAQNRFGGAESDAWCLFYDPYTYNCGFATVQQCHASRQGVGGRCQPNPSGPPQRVERMRREKRDAR